MNERLKVYNKKIKVKQDIKNPKVFIRTFGCQMNEYDSERISYLLEKEGFKETDNIGESDIIIINTCAVREKTKNRLYGYLGNLKKIKEKNHNILICVGGCTAQNLKEKIIKDFPFIDIVFGTHNISDLPKLIKNIRFKNKSICSVKEIGFDYDLNMAKRTVKFKAYVPIIIGCNNYCSYCIVPYVRGRETSIPPENIIKNIKNLVSDGVVEVTLLGQNVNSYGKDLNKKITFAKLLENISYIDGLERIRFMTSHPKDFSIDIIDVIRDRKNIVNHIHLPLQSGSDRILKLMNRKYTSKEYLNIINFIREKIPDCSITTDIIVGFPGEEREDFLKTLDMIKKIRFNRAFTFIYSPRAGTKAAKIKNTVPVEQKKKWFNQLVELQNKISYKENKKLVGKKVKVLVEGESKKDKNGLNYKIMLEGRMENNIIINFKGDKKLIGNIEIVKIKEAKSFYLLGEL